MAQTSETINRSVIYRWLAQFYVSPPEEIQLARYRENDGQEFLASCKAIPVLHPFVALLQGLVAPEADLDKTRDQIASEFSRSFDVGGPRSAPPYASVYASERGLLYQQPARDMNNLLEQLDMRLPEEMNEPADHLAVQLDVLAELTDREAEGMATPLTPVAFLEKHLLTWLPAFSRQYSQITSSGFYTILSRAVLDIAQQDFDAAISQREAN